MLVVTSPNDLSGVTKIHSTIRTSAAASDQQAEQNADWTRSEPYLLFERASDTFCFLPPHPSEHSESIGLNGNTIIIRLCRLTNTKMMFVWF